MSGRQFYIDDETGRGHYTESQDDVSASDSIDLLCSWTRAFDGHFNISCNSGERANGNFKGKDAGAKWEFKYCPYCGKQINETVT